VKLKIFARFEVSMVVVISVWSGMLHHAIWLNRYKHTEATGSCKTLVLTYQIAHCRINRTVISNVSNL